MRIIEFIFRDFITWLGSMMFLYFIVNSIVNLINNFMYHRTVRKVGYPPNHCLGNPGEETIKENTDDN